MKNPKILTELLIIGGSAGSLQVILEMLKNLNSNLDFPIVLVIHRKAQSTNVLQTLLQQFSTLNVIEIEDKTETDTNTIYVAPADYHLLFENKNIMSLDRSEKLNYSRPSIDVTFISAAEVYKENLVAVLLSGANADGVEGLEYIKKKGGKVWIQDPETADVKYMPKQALDRVLYDCIIRPSDLAKKINEL